mgnify:CR=1 FL=1
MRSLFRIYAAFVVISIFFTACTSREARRPERVSVEFWHSMGRRHSTVLNEIIADFEQANPDVRINAVYQGSYNSLLTNLTASSTAETNPVMSQMYESWTTRFINHDLLISVDEMNEKYGGLSQESIRDIPRVFIRDNTWNGRLFTLPFNKSAYVLYFNRDAMKEIGLVEENGRGRAPVTWEEFRNASKKLKIERDGSVKRYGFGIRPFIEGYTTFLFRAGGRYLNEDGDKVLFTDDVGQETMEYLVSLVNEDESGYVEPDYLSTAFGTGRIAMYVGTIASMPYNARAVSDKFDWDTAPIPYPEEKKEVARTLFQGTNVGVFSNHSEEKIEAAWRFLKFLTSTESAATWSVGTGYLPIRYSVLETEKMQSYLKDNPRYRTPVSLLDNGTFEPRVPIWEPMRKVITDHFEAALNGRRTPEETINIMARKCRKIIETF